MASAEEFTVRDDMIAVVGMSCRLPKAADPDAFWQLLRGGGDAITKVPAGRQDIDRSRAGEALPGTSYGGYLESVDRFDAEFFGISPREAVATDPQQRLVLELSWEAFEDAGIVPGSVSGDRVGVFIGANRDDYATLLHQSGLDTITAHSNTGLQRGMIANRVSYTFGLSGPSMTVDTAQSSSLVAVHLACDSLRRGECTSALVGGVKLNISPETAVEEAMFGGLSPDGRCFTFDSRANGYARGEGGAVVLLKPLSGALADGDLVYCVIRGSAVNNDGVSDGLTVPSGAAQEAVIRLACQRAGLQSADVQYVELHGTGTRVGDPVEAAVNGPARTVVSGLEAAVEQAAQAWRESGGRARRLRVSHAFHSPLMDPALEDLGRALARVTFRELRVPLVTGVPGADVTSPAAVAAYVIAQLDTGLVPIADDLTTPLAQLETALKEGDEQLRRYARSRLLALLDALGEPDPPQDDEESLLAVAEQGQKRLSRMDTHGPH